MPGGVLDRKIERHTVLVINIIKSNRNVWSEGHIFFIDEW